MTWQCTKTYGHDLGLSCCFRQPKATHSHCSLLHGYALSFKFTFECDQLDDRNWVVDFGGLKWLKEQLQDAFDHTLAIDVNDPAYNTFVDLAFDGLAKVKVFPSGVGCEKFAEYAFRLAERGLERGALGKPGIRVISCECAEHGANSAIYREDYVR